MKWPKIAEIAAKIQIPDEYRLEQLSSKDVPILIERIKQWYPDVLVGEESCHLEPQFFQHQTLLRECTDDRDIFPLIFQLRDSSEIVGFMTLEKNPRSLTLTGRLGSIAPTHRGLGLGWVYPQLLEVFGRAIGAEAIVQIVTLRSPHQQVIGEKLGYRLAGILPGYDRDLIAPGVIKRVFEAFYIKLLVDESEFLHLPSHDNLTDQTKKLWQFLFPDMKPTDEKE